MRILTILLIITFSIFVDSNRTENGILERSREIGEDDMFILPTSSGDEVELESSNDTVSDFKNIEIEVRKVSDEVQTYFDQHPRLSTILISVASAILILAVFSICRCVCCRKKRFTATMHIAKMNDDLFETTIYSQRYEKTTLPNNEEVTMRLVSADNSMV